MNQPAARKRRTREDLKELVMEAALELIRTEGLGAEPTTLTYQRVFDHLEATRGVRVTRASVHERIWDSQESFRLEALIAASPWRATSSEITVEPALDMYDATEGLAPLERMREMTRVAAQSTQQAAEDDPLYYSWAGMTMAMAKDPSIEPSHRQLLRDAVGVAYHEINTRLTGVLRVLGDTLGVRPRRDLFTDPDEGWNLIVKLGTALSEGATVRTRLSEEELPNVMLATGPNGELQEWSAFAAGYWALLHTFIEVDPGATRLSDESGSSLAE